MARYPHSPFIAWQLALGSCALVSLGACEDDDLPVVDTTSSVPTSGSHQTSTSSASDSTATSGSTSSTSASESNTSSQDSTSTTVPSDLINGSPTLDVACAFGPRNPTRLAVSSTDGSTGAVGLVDVAKLTVTPDLAAAHTDTSLTVQNGLVYLINRLGSDTIKALDPGQNLNAIGEFSLQQAGESINPHSLIRSDDGRLFISQYERNELAIWRDFPAPTKVGGIDLTSFADGDGIAETGSIVHCGNTLFLEWEPLDRNNGWVPAGKTTFIPIDLVSGRFFDAQSDGKPDTIELPGQGMSKVISDPRDPSGHSVLVAQNPGITSVNLATGQSQWVIDRATFVEHGIDLYGLMSFDLADDNTTLWFTVASPDWSEFSLWSATIGQAGKDLTRQVNGLTMVTGAIDLIGQQAWVSDTNSAMPGLRIFDLSQTPPVEVAGSPLSVGLAPYGFIGLP